MDAMQSAVLGSSKKNQPALLTVPPCATGDAGQEAVGAVSSTSFELLAAIYSSTPPQALVHAAQALVQNARTR